MKRLSLNITIILLLLLLLCTGVLSGCNIMGYTQPPKAVEDEDPAEPSAAVTIYTDPDMDLIRAQNENHQIIPGYYEEGGVLIRIRSRLPDATITLVKGSYYPKLNYFKTSEVVNTFEIGLMPMAEIKLETEGGTLYCVKSDTSREFCILSDVPGVTTLHRTEHSADALNKDSNMLDIIKAYALEAEIYGSTDFAGDQNEIWRVISLAYSIQDPLDYSITYDGESRWPIEDWLASAYAKVVFNNEEGSMPAMSGNIVELMPDIEGTMRQMITHERAALARYDVVITSVTSNNNGSFSAGVAITDKTNEGSRPSRYMVTLYQGGDDMNDIPFGYIITGIVPAEG